MAESERSGQYSGTATGLMVQFLDFRLRDDDQGVPRGNPGQLWEDTTFDLHDAIQNPDVTRRLEWKRPGELSDHPQLYTDGSTRFDVGQGNIGTCWFLAMASNIAPHSKLLREVIPEDAYPIGTESYKGIFHARFWHFGQWEDVYIDDRLPVFRGTRQLWGASSASDPDEFWVALLEKAFAKFYGSYNAVHGGQSGDAYIALTGGLAEVLEYEDDENKLQKTFTRIHNALRSGAFVAASVPGQHDKILGLVGNHAYSVTGTAKVREESLIRMRNPWGKGEWKGAWSDGSGEWEGVSESELPRAVKDDGEFWMRMADFMLYFTNHTVCSLTPDFDQDGVHDSLNYVTNIFGEWKGESAAGGDDDNLLKNPRFKFSVPRLGFTDVPVVFQLIQRRERKKNANNFFINCNVYKVLDQTDRNATVRIQGENTRLYVNSCQRTFRYKLASGTHLVVPSTNETGKEGTFLLRLFSSAPLKDISFLPKNLDIITSESVRITSGEESFSLDHVKTVNGAWRSRVNAGGQISNRSTHASNPQFVITLSNKGAVDFKLCQDDDEPNIPIGLSLFPTGNAPMDIDEIYRMIGKQELVMNIEGKPYIFVRGPFAQSTYVLNPGQYTLLIHTDEPNQEKAFTLLVTSSSLIELRAYQIGM